MDWFLLAKIINLLYHKNRNTFRSYRGVGAMSTLNTVFQGRPKVHGGVSNIENIIKKCPTSFYQKNYWSDFINIIIYRDNYDQVSWPWKSKDNNTRQHQFSYLFGLIHAPINIEDKLAVAGWYLSEILKSVPEYKRISKLN